MDAVVRRGNPSHTKRLEDPIGPGYGDSSLSYTARLSPYIKVRQQKPVRSFHDYWLLGHSVDGESEVLTLHLSEDPRGVGKPEKVDVVFTGLMDYFLEHDLGVSIVFSVD